MSEVKVVDGNVDLRPLVQNGAYYVLVSHQELDSLIGRMMQLFELNGDIEQRDALKQEFKWRSREWLDELYTMAGYTNHHLSEKANIVTIKEN